MEHVGFGFIYTKKKTNPFLPFGGFFYQMASSCCKPVCPQINVTLPFTAPVTGKEGPQGPPGTGIPLFNVANTIPLDEIVDLDTQVDIGSPIPPNVGLLSSVIPGAEETYYNLYAGVFDEATGIFTAPKTGFYLVNANMTFLLTQPAAFALNYVDITRLFLIKLSSGSIIQSSSQSVTVVGAGVGDPAKDHRFSLVLNGVIRADEGETYRLALARTISPDIAVTTQLFLVGQLAASLTDRPSFYSITQIA